MSETEYVGAGKEDCCEMCQFYIPIDSGYGHCRRFPPTTVKRGWWRVTHDIEYQIVEWCRRACGEFRLRIKH
jgi:hypothetical protein